MAPLFLWPGVRSWSVLLVSRLRLDRDASRAFPRLRHGATSRRPSMLLRVKSQFPEDLVVVLAEVWRSLGRRLGDAVHLNRAGDRRGQLAAGAFERDDHVVCATAADR